jgi:hypothetical protein
MVAKGIQLLMGDGGGTEVFTLVPSVVEWQNPNINWGLEELTNNDSATLVTTRDVTTRTKTPIKFLIKPFVESQTQHALLMTRSRDGASWNYKITHPGSSIGSFGPFAAIVTVHKPETARDKIAAATVELTPTGDIIDSLPTLSSVTVIDSAGPVYTTGEIIILRATFDEVVNVTGTPRIPVQINATTRQANYVSGSGTNQLEFRYTIVGGDSGNPGQNSVTSPLQLNGGTILDVLGQAPAALTFTPPNTAAWDIN